MRDEQREEEVKDGVKDASAAEVAKAGDIMVAEELEL